MPHPVRGASTVRLLLLGRPDDPLTEQLADRARERGVTVVESTGDVDAAVDTWIGPLEERRSRLRGMEGGLPPNAPILACCHDRSATSLAAGLSDPTRLVGFGLWPPLAERRTVECARALQTRDDVAARAEAVWSAVGLQAVWVVDGAGLVTARVVSCLANEAAFALMEGAATANDIDRAMTLGTGYPRGPLAWASEVGIDHVLAVLDGLAAEHGDDRYRAAPLLRKLVEAGRTRGPVW